MSALSDILRQEIQQGGPIPFARFMDQALYCPELGYYDRFANTIGRAGDYFTNVSVGPLLGELLARQFADWLAALPGGTVQLVEAGAHDGQLAHDLLVWLQRSRPDMWERLRYWILEPSARRQEWQRQKLLEFASRIRWVDAWDRLPERAVRGVIFSNELLDALPAHRLGWDAASRRWFEWGVGFEGGRFVWRRMPDRRERAPAPAPGGTAEVASMAALAPADLPAELLAVLPDGFTTEVCPQAVEWWTHAASRLGAGRLLTLDYGLRSEEFLTPARSEGTLRAYRAHRLCRDVLADPGAQDLTAHVNFSALQAAGEAAGLSTEGCWTQGVFLTRVVQTDPTACAVSTPAQARQFQTLTHPEHLGARFQVLVQSRTAEGASGARGA